MSLGIVTRATYHPGRESGLPSRQAIPRDAVPAVGRHDRWSALARDRAPHPAVASRQPHARATSARRRPAPLGIAREPEAPSQPPLLASQRGDRARLKPFRSLAVAETEAYRTPLLFAMQRTAAPQARTEALAQDS